VTAGRDVDFTEFVESSVPALRRLAYMLCHDWHSADDLVQATVTRLYVRWAKAAAADNLEAYVRTMLFREFLHERRTSWSRHVHLTANCRRDRQRLSITTRPWTSRRRSAGCRRGSEPSWC